MKSIRIRLVILFILVTTATLATFGVYGQYQLSHHLEQHFSQLMHATSMRLELGLPDLVWNVDQEGILRNLNVEMLQDEVNAIQVFDAKDNLLATALRDPQGHVISGLINDDFNGIRVETKLYHGDPSVENTQVGTATRYNLGRTVVYFSRQQIDQTLNADTQRWMTEALVVDLLLVLALTFSLQMVFVPLQRLRDALLGLADSADDAVQELPEAGHTEFVEVIRGFNLTQRKVRQIMQRHAEATLESHASAERAEHAYAVLQSAQQSLVEAERLASLGGLVAGVAHEINTPVGITLTGASVLLDASDKLQARLANGSLRKSEITAYVALACESTRLILNNAERAAHLIQSFKQVAADQTSEQRRIYELQQYLKEIIASLWPLLKQHKVQVKLQCQDAITLDGYPGALAQVMTILTMNALTHAFKDLDGGDIDVVVRRIGDRAEITVRDNGCGIAPEHLGKVFEPFFTTRRTLGSTGLGLNIAHNIMIKQFGGTLEAQSALGQGSCFILNFPLVSPLAASH
jgi:signal transduction histidine kinase